mmetsp:Transcript_98590/g.190377  ORF Transcript_98590/g.190377 Transcript_98590/m.190377 type:complete len:181 (+) Transcript_98590:55-597(+)
MGCSHCAKAQDQMVKTPMLRPQVGARNFDRQEDDYAVVLTPAGCEGGGQNVDQVFGSHPRQPNWNTAGTGHQLGGNPTSELGDTQCDELSPEDKREKALSAAHRRQAEVPGLSQKAAKELRERQQREELLGKLTEHYARKKKDAPMGLNMASLEQLRQYWSTIQQQQGGEDTATRVLESS